MWSNISIIKGAWSSPMPTSTFDWFSLIYHSHTKQRHIGSDIVMQITGVISEPRPTYPQFWLKDITSTLSGWAGFGPLVQPVLMHFIKIMKPRYWLEQFLEGRYYIHRLVLNEEAVVLALCFLCLPQSFRIDHFTSVWWYFPDWFYCTLRVSINLINKNRVIQ